MLFMVMDKVQGRLYLVQAEHKYHARRRVRDRQLQEMSNEERARQGYALVDMNEFGVCEVQAEKIDFMEVEPMWIEAL